MARGPPHVICQLSARTTDCACHDQFQDQREAKSPVSRASGTREISRSCLCVGVFISLMIEQAISFTEKPILPYSSIDFFIASEHT